ncbi:hypothetical protein PHYPSEUDO_003739 [Phytophthora pseudosyringae]|uniref:Uncharacterized protein n=1 Tax=Phytophthora pseudosyringae TaxID=221518 RepID=A0A8T1VTC4_9STRA|nr:hypothetical protein PHYPSEUDO_003739 [Phytophthora pseudosyringae]
MCRLLRTEPHYQQFQLTFALVEAVKYRDLDMIKRLLGHLSGWIVEKVEEEAAPTGDMELLQYFLENDIDAAGSEVPDDETDTYQFVCWGEQDMARAAAVGHRDVVE